MLIVVLSQLCLCVAYAWGFLPSLGYHGAFGLLLMALWVGAYVSWWELYWCWTMQLHYWGGGLLWVDLGNHLLVYWEYAGYFGGLLLLCIMCLGAFIVLSFVYLEMWDDKEGANFATLLIFFLFFMGVLVSGANLFLFYLGWEGIGLTSLFLINFWSERSRGIKATLKVFSINKVGDFLILGGLCLLLGRAGLWDLGGQELASGLLLQLGVHQLPLSDVISCLFVAGGGVKSAQFGPHIWLLEAMEAPLGASALMHSSTLVVAGIFLVLRLHSLILSSAYASMLLVLWGSWTAFFAICIAMYQYELKIILAYSTISSMGLMYLLLGLGAYWEVMYYLVVHAFLKILLFLLIGALMFHGGGSQEIRILGGLWYYAGGWLLMYTIAALGLCGLPFISGYYCKTPLWGQMGGSPWGYQALSFIFLGCALATMLALGRLGWIVGGLLRAGHRGMYRARFPVWWPSWCIGFLYISAWGGGYLWQVIGEVAIFVSPANLFGIYSHGFAASTLPWVSWGLLLSLYWLGALSFLYLYEACCSRLGRLRPLYFYWGAICFFLVIFIFLDSMGLTLWPYMGLLYANLCWAGIGYIGGLLVILVTLLLIRGNSSICRWSWWGRQWVHTFAREWLYTTNHKKLGLMYIWFAALSATLGTTLATLIRLELSQPGSSVFMGNGGAYHIVVAIHAILMVFFVVTPVVFGGFGNYFLPTQVGARDVAYPRLNNFSVWLLPAGLISTLRALWDGMSIGSSRSIAGVQYSGANWQHSLWPNGRSSGYSGGGDLYHISHYSSSSQTYSAAPYLGNTHLYGGEINQLLAQLQPASDLTMTMAGWTFTTPFSHSRFTGRAVDMAAVGLVFATITSIFTTINLVTSWRFLRGRGARYQKELFPIFLIALFIALRLLLLVSPILTAGFIMLLADRHFLTAFFTIRAGGDVLLFQHIFWFFGHPEVYILVIPGFGVASTLVPYYTRKPISSKMHMVYAMHAIGSMSMVVWGHHMYLVGIDSKARTLFMTITIMIGLPSTIKICGWVVSLTNGLTHLCVDLWLAIIFISVFFVGGMSGLMVAGAGLDILLHDTYYVVGHFHVMLSGAMILSIMGWIYFNFREIFGTAYSWLLGGLHLGGHLIGHIACFIPMLWLGYGGMPRRIQDYPYCYSGWHSVASWGHLIVLGGILCFASVIAQATYFKRPLVGRHAGLPFITTRLAWLSIEGQAK